MIVRANQGSNTVPLTLCTTGAPPVTLSTQGARSRAAFRGVSASWRYRVSLALLPLHQRHSIIAPGCPQGEMTVIFRGRPGQLPVTIAAGAHPRASDAIEAAVAQEVSGIGSTPAP